jgi:hypothetical protein
MHTKTEKKETPRLRQTCSAERADQLMNDLREGVASGNVREWRAVAEYWQARHDYLLGLLNSARPSISALLAAERIRAAALPELERWLEQPVP